GVSTNLAEVRTRKQRVVESFRNSGLKTVESTSNLTLIHGSAAFKSSTVLEATLNDGGARLLTAPKIVINTGGRPSRPDFHGCDSIQALNSTSIMELDRLPSHLLVVGGGYVGLEFGQMFKRFGSEVTIIQRGPHLLPREDLDVAVEVEDILRSDGVNLMLDSQPSSVRRDQAGGIELTLRTSQSDSVVKGSHLLIAIRRKPYVE